MKTVLSEEKGRRRERGRWREREGLGSPSSVRSVKDLLQDTRKDGGAGGHAEMRR